MERTSQGSRGRIDARDPSCLCEKTRLALLITELAPGGAEKALVQLVLGLDRARYEPVVFSMSGRARDLERSLAPLLRDRGIEVVELGLTGAFGFPGVFFRLFRELRARRIQILQSFMFHANILGRLAGRLARVPVICSGIRVAERDSTTRLTLDRLTGSFVDAWICVGESTATFTKEVGGIPANRVYSIGNGVQAFWADGRIRVATSGDLCVSSAEGNEQARLVEPSLIPPEPFGRRKRAIAIGRLHAQKGFDRLLEEGLKGFPSDWELWVVGEGEERERLMQLRDCMGLSDRVFFTGWRADASELLAQSDLFLLSSRWEGVPNVLLEACALGKCALCADVEGVAEILGPDSEQQRCAWGDGTAWNDRLERLTLDDKLREKLGQRNQERVLREFTIERVVDKYDRLWTRLLFEREIEKN